MTETIDISQFPIEKWQSDDERFPQGKDLIRTPPESEFVESIKEYGQLDAVMVGHNEKDGWFLIDGAKRLLAIRVLAELDPVVYGNVVVMIGEGITEGDGKTYSLLKNAQRSDNEFNAYAIIKHILKSDKQSTYKSIAETIHKPSGYVKKIAIRYAKVPDWALAAALDGKIAKATALKVGSFTKGIQSECKKEFDASGKLTEKSASNKRRAIQKDMVMKMSPAMGFAQPTSKRQPFYPVKILDDLRVLLAEGKYPQAKKILEDLLS
jgi:ParB-like chromosome segregation protein Spo0J